MLILSFVFSLLLWGGPAALLAPSAALLLGGLSVLEAVRAGASAASLRVKDPGKPLNGVGLVSFLRVN